MNYLRSLGLKAGYIGERIINGTAQIDLLYGSPQSFVGEEKVRGMFSNKFYRKHVAAVVCDEVHTVVHW